MPKYLSKVVVIFTNPSFADICPGIKVPNLVLFQVIASSGTFLSRASQSICKISLASG